MLPFPKIVINLPRRTMPVEWLARSFGTHRQRSFYFIIRMNKNKKDQGDKSKECERDQKQWREHSVKKLEMFFKLRTFLLKKTV